MKWTDDNAETMPAATLGLLALMLALLVIMGVGIVYVRG